MFTQSHSSDPDLCQGKLSTFTALVLPSSDQQRPFDKIRRLREESEIDLS